MRLPLTDSPSVMADAAVRGQLPGVHSGRRFRSAARRPLRSGVLSTSTEDGSAGDLSVHSGDPLNSDYIDRRQPLKFYDGEETIADGHDSHPSLAISWPSHENVSMQGSHAMRQSTWPRHASDASALSSTIRPGTFCSSQ
ncbi:hypothetical protein VPH35_006316 [Triticum aestivum]